AYPGSCWLRRGLGFAGVRFLASLGSDFVLLASLGSDFVLFGFAGVRFCSLFLVDAPLRRIVDPHPCHDDCGSNSRAPSSISWRGAMPARKSSATIRTDDA